MCATVCPSGALTFTTLAEIERKRGGHAINEWTFGAEQVQTKVFVMAPERVERMLIEGLQSEVAPRSAGPERRDLYDVAELLEG